MVVRTGKVISARWLARAAFALVLAAAADLVGFADLASLAMVGVGAAGACLMLAGGYWFLAHRGVLRWAAFAVVVLAPVAVLVIFARHGLLWVALVAVALIVLAGGAGRRALVAGPGASGMPGREVPPPEHAFVIMNPRSGGGKVARFGLKERAETLGAEVALLEGPGTVDVAALARRAVAGGADLLGVAGGDGTQALVAGIAAEHDLPFLVISAGTRNHFALDLGLDREDPAACLNALTDGVEQRIDLGLIGDRTFVNNASFGAYAEVVRSPAYRDDKRGTTLAILPDLLSGHRGATLTVRAGAVTVTGPQTVLVSNNTYAMSDIAGLGRRARLDAGTLGIIVITVNSAMRAVELLGGGGMMALAADEVVVDADEPEIPVGIDGETVMMPTPVRCTIRPQALRVRVPRDRPGVRPPKPRIDWPALRTLALVRSAPVGAEREEYVSDLSPAELGTQGDHACPRQRSADAEGERTRSADLAGGPGHGRRVGQAELRDPLQPDLEGDPEFHARQVGAEAAVDAEAERGVPVDLTVDDDLIGAVELGRVAIGRRERQQDPVVGRHVDAAPVHVFLDQACHGDRCVSPEELLDRGRQ